MNTDKLRQIAALILDIANELDTPATATPELPAVHVNGQQLTATVDLPGEIVEANISVRNSLSWVTSVSRTTAPGKGTLTLSGQTDLKPGTYWAYVSITEDGDTWITGPETEFTVEEKPAVRQWPAGPQIYWKIWHVDAPIAPIHRTIPVLYLAFAQGNPLQLVGPSGSGWIALRELVTQRNRDGLITMLAIGGAGSGSSNSPLGNPVKQAQAVKAISDELGGIHGVDLNYEHASTLPSPGEHIAFAKAVRELIPGAFITIPPGGQNTTNSYGPASALHKEGLLTQVGFQHYDHTRDITEIDVIIARAKAYGIPVDKLALGMMLGSEPTHHTLDSTTKWWARAKSLGIDKAYLWTENSDFPDNVRHWTARIS